MKKLMALLLVLAMLATLALTGCGAPPNSPAASTPGSKDASQEGDSELLEYTFVFYGDDASKWANNPNDVVTKYVEEKFNIRVKDVIIVKSEDFQQRLNQWIATDTVPEVICCGDTGANYAVSTGKFAVLDKYIDKMENYNRYFDQQYWPRFMNDGQRYQIPNVTLNLNGEEYADDPYNPGDMTHCLWVREDILSMLGYTFTPMEEIAEKTAKEGTKPTAEDFAIQPAIDTPEKFYDLLKQIKALDLKSAGRDVIPLSVTNWQQFHIGSMFDFGHWRIDKDGNVAGYLGTPGAKEYYRFLSKMYNEGLIDPDFIIQTDEQLQEKIATGQVAAGMAVPDLAGAMSTMATVNPDAKIRYIPWPKQDKDLGVYDIFQGGGYRYIISNALSDEELERLTQYFDWFYSDEGMDLITWGPEDAGLWEMKDGVKVFKDEAVAEACMNGTYGANGADYYGLYDPFGVESPFWSKAAMATPIMTHGNPFSYTRSYPVNLNVYDVANAVLGCTGVDYKGIASSGDNGENANATSSFYWNQFTTLEIAKLLNAKTDEEFDKAWDEVYANFLKDGKYEAAKADMEKWFATYGPEA